MDTLSLFQSLASGDLRTVAIAITAASICVLAPFAWRKTGGTFYRPMVAAACFAVLAGVVFFGFGLMIAASVAITLFILTFCPRLSRTHHAKGSRIKTFSTSYTRTAPSTKQDSGSATADSAQVSPSSTNINQRSTSKTMQIAARCST